MVEIVNEDTPTNHQNKTGTKRQINLKFTLVASGRLQGLPQNLGRRSPPITPSGGELGSARRRIVCDQHLANPYRAWYPAILPTQNGSLP